MQLSDLIRRLEPSGQVAAATIAHGAIAWGAEPVAFVSDPLVDPEQFALVEPGVFVGQMLEVMYGPGARGVTS